jgi:hypothetical protein
MVWPLQKDVRGQNSKINYVMDITGEKERGRARKTRMKGVQAAMTTRNLEPDQWRNREEWRLVSGRRGQLLKIRVDILPIIFRTTCRSGLPSGHALRLSCYEGINDSDF